MVGFESSLRQSRRRGWEDAYLDYQSLHLLLTQIEAVYEEEDWKRGGSGRNNNDSFAQLPTNFNELEDTENGIAGDSMRTMEDDGLLKSFWKNAVRMSRQIIAPGSSSSNRSGSSLRRIRRASSPGSMDGGFNNSSNSDSNNNNWISNDYFDYSTDQYRRKQKRGGKESSTSHDRALDRGGWRSAGVKDYRDELFLVSDEDVAYGNFVEGQSDGDGDDWTDDEEEEESLSEEFDDEVDPISDAHHDDVDGIHSDNIRISPLPASDDVKSVSKKLTPVTDASENDDSKKIDSSRSRSYESPPTRDQDKLVHLWTPDTSPTTSPTNEKRQLVGRQKVKFSDSPGLLEAGYETFAAAAARSGYVQPGGDESHMMMVGSPSEQRGWLGGVIPNWLGGGGGGGRQQKQPTETDPLLLSCRESQVQVFGRSNVIEETSRPISTLQNHPKPKEVDSWLNISDDRIAYMTGELKPPFTPVSSNETEAFDKPYKPIPVPATAAGGSMPETPTESPVTPTFSYLASSSSEKQREQKKSGGGFGVSLNMIPTTEFMNPSSSSTSNRKSPEDAKLGMSQFYSFQNKDDTYPSSNNNDRVECSTTRNDLEPIEEYDGGDEHELGTSNMISFYSYSGGNDDGYLSVRSPTPVARRHNPSQQRSLLSSEKMSISDGSNGGGIMRYLFGATNIAHNGSKRTLQTEGLTTHKRGGDARPSSNENARNNRKRRGDIAYAKQERARLRKQRRLRRQRERVPVYLRLAHARAATITERYVIIDIICV
jgi:hypothetical protein